MCGAALRGAEVAPETDAPVARDAIAYDPSGLGERRHVTVMFCDLCDSVVLGQRLDPEELHKVVRAYQEACARVVRRYEGHVARFEGDGLLVYFGYPYAHENDAERGTSAGLEIVEEVARLSARLESSHGVHLAVRVGIHSGLVVVGATGGDQPEMQMIGHTLNLAQRLQGVAEPGSVVISAATLHLVRGRFVTRDLGLQVVKGIPEPVPAYAVLRPTGARDRLEGAAATGLTPFVDREHEVALLLDRWQQVTEGHGQAVLLSGEAGIGKSRLARVLRERIAEASPVWLESHCSPYHQHTAFHPVVELLERGLELRRDGSASEQAAQLERAVESAGLPLEEVVPLLASLLSVPLEGRGPVPPPNAELQRSKTLEWLVAWLIGSSAEHPAVLIVEDLHWIDPSTKELLGMLLEQVPAAAMLVVVTSRPLSEIPWASRSSVMHLTLHPLTQKQVGAMIEGIAATLPPAVRRQVATKTDGVPLFVEELTKAVLESDLLRETPHGRHHAAALPEFAIPSTLQDSLMARLDRLGTAKDVAQLGAVIGREFSHALLRAVAPMDETFVDDALRELVRAELVYQRGIPPQATYRFKHALVQEAAYQSLLRSRRQEAHARIVHVLKERFPERVAGEPEEMARHCAEAGLGSEAIGYYRLAGDRAARGSAHAEAASHLTKALELLRTLPEDPERNRQELALQVALGPPLIAIRGYGDSEVELTYERARALCEKVDAAPHLWESVWGLANYYQSRSELVTARAFAEQLVSMAERVHEAPLVAWAHLQLGATLFWQGNPSEAREHLERSIAVHAPAERMRLPGAPDAGVAARAYTGWVLWQLGYPDRGLENGREAVALARTCGDPFSLALALCFAAGVCQLRREPEPVRALAEEVIALATAQQFPLWRGMGHMLLGWALAHSGDGERGIDEIQQGLAQLATIGTEVGASGGLAVLADAQRVVAGHEAEAFAAVEAGLAFAEMRQQHTWDAQLHRLKGDLLLQMGGTRRRPSAASARRSRCRRRNDRRRSSCGRR